MVDTTRQELLRRAAKLMGAEELAIRLKVPGTTLEAWVNGSAHMPDRKLTLLVDILDDISGFKR